MSGRRAGMGPAEPPAGQDLDRWEILPDVPMRVPALGYNDVARELASLILGGTPRFSIALIGPWGSGKTTLMQSIRSHIRDLQRQPAAAGADPRRVVEITFDAWRFDRQEPPVVALLESIRAGLEAWRADVCPDHLETTALRAIRKLETFNSTVSDVIVKGQVSVGVPILNASVDVTRSIKGDSSGPRLLQDRLSEGLVEVLDPLIREDVRLVTYLDDLDRAEVTSVLQVLSFLKMLFDLHGLIFVVGLDLDALRRAADTRTSESEVTRFIEKIFQLTYSMPRIDGLALKQLVATMCSDLTARQMRHIVDQVVPHLAHLSGGRVTPRQIKRFINRYVIHMRVLRRPERFREVLAAMMLQANHDSWEVRADEPDDAIRRLEQVKLPHTTSPSGLRAWMDGPARGLDWADVLRVAHEVTSAGSRRALLSDALFQVRAIRDDLRGALAAEGRRSTPFRIQRRVHSLACWLPEALGEPAASKLGSVSDTGSIANPAELMDLLTIWEGVLESA